MTRARPSPDQAEGPDSTTDSPQESWRPQAGPRRSPPCVRKLHHAGTLQKATSASVITHVALNVSAVTSSKLGLVSSAPTQKRQEWRTECAVGTKSSPSGHPTTVLIFSVRCRPAREAPARTSRSRPICSPGSSPFPGRTGNSRLILSHRRCRRCRPVRSQQGHAVHCAPCVTTAR
jgi:hypothetical protein